MLTGEWRDSEGCFKAKPHRLVVPKTTDSRATEWGKRFFVDLAEGMHVPRLGSSICIIFVDNCMQLKVAKILEKKSDAASVLQRNFLADVITLEKLMIKSIRTDNGGKIEGLSAPAGQPRDHP